MSPRGGHVVQLTQHAHGALAGTHTSGIAGVAPGHTGNVVWGCRLTSLGVAGSTPVARVVVACHVAPEVPGAITQAPTLAGEVAGSVTRALALRDVTTQRADV